MTNLLIKRNGTNFEVSNGTITISGPNRAMLLTIMDGLEGQQASADKIQEKVDKAAEVAKEKKNPETTKTVKAPKEQVSKKKISNSQKVRDFMAKSKGKVTVEEVVNGTGLTSKQCSDILWRLWQADELKSHHTGIYFK